MVYTEHDKCREMAKSSSFYRLVYSEYLDVDRRGWVGASSDVGGRPNFSQLSHLESLQCDCQLHLSHCIICIRMDEKNIQNKREIGFSFGDMKERSHVMVIRLDKSYPRHPPSVSADVPYIFDVEWSVSSRLKDVVHQFREHLEKLQEFWSTMDDIDRSLWIVDPIQPSRATSIRHINIGNDCCIMVSINARDPTSIPECRFMGSGPAANNFRRAWRRNSKRWIKGQTIPEKIACLLGTQLPRPPDVQKNDHQVECGICYAQCLPFDDELGSESGSATDYTCDNSNCSRAFHSICLGEWLRSITTTRQSFNVLFGNCPYCSEPVAVKTNTNKS